MAHRLGGTTLVLTSLAVTVACGGSASRDRAGGDTGGSGGSAATTAVGGRSGSTGAAGAGGQGQAGSGGDRAGGSGGASGDPTGGVGSGAIGGTGGVGGAGGNAGTIGVTGGTGGSVVAGGSAGTGGATGGASGATAGAGGATVGSVGGTMGGEGGALGTGGGSGGTGGSGAGGTGGSWHSPGPCDIYAAELTPCVAAYSMVRRLLSTYDGPLYQVRSESSSQNTGSGGTTHNIGMTADGFADKEHQDEVCSGTMCTVSLLYDQSGHDNHLSVAKKGRSDGGEYAAYDDFESVATDGPLTVGGHDVYSLCMDARQGYRLPVDVVGNSMPVHEDPQGIYMLADGTHSGTQCCWDFGNVSPDPTAYTITNALFFGVGYWGGGAGDGPWFMADFEAGIWAGGRLPGDPGSPTGPPNEYNPSLQVPFALGFLKTDASGWALRMTNSESTTGIITAYEGSLPKEMNNPGGIVLGVDSSNSNNSWGTFYEGAVVSGYPSEDTELAVLQNIQGVGYGR